MKEIVVDATVSGIVGAAAGAGGSDFVKGGKVINDAVSSVKKLSEKAVHPKTRKIAKKAINKAIKYTLKSTASGIVEDFAYGAIFKGSSWYVNKSTARMLGW